MYARKALVVVILLASVAPLWIMATGSLQDIFGIMKMPPALIPSSITMANYTYVLGNILPIWVLNSIVLVVGLATLSVVVHCLAGYVFAFYTFRFKKLVWAILISALFIPRVSLLIPLYVIIRKLGISGSILAVILTSTFSPVNLYLARNYFASIPKAILESARMDGASELQILVKIIIPVSMPIVSAIAMFSVIMGLSDYVWQSLVLQAPESQTLLVGLIKLTQDRQGIGKNINPLGRSLAAGMVLVVPMVSIFIASNRYFIKGVLNDSVKE